MKNGIAISLRAIAVCALLGVSHASATTLYDNLSAASALADPAGIPQGLSAPFGPLYDSFSTGTTSFSLDRVTLFIQGDPSSAGAFNVSVLNDNSTTPGSSIFTSPLFSDSVLSASLSPFTVSFSPILLSANTRYWIELAAANTSSVLWSWTMDASGPGVANEFFANSSGVFDNATYGPYQMQIGSTPLPGALPLFVTGVLLLGTFAWQRRRMTVADLLTAGS